MKLIKKMLAIVGVAALGIMAVPSAAFAADDVQPSFDAENYSCADDGSIVQGTLALGGEEGIEGWLVTLDTAYAVIPAGVPVPADPGAVFDTTLDGVGTGYVGGLVATAVAGEGYSFGENQAVFPFDYSKPDCEIPVVVPEQPEPIVTTSDESNTDCDEGVVETWTTTTTINWVLDEENNTWVQTEPIVSEPVLTETRAATTEECPGDDTVVQPTFSAQNYTCGEDGSTIAGWIQLGDEVGIDYWMIQLDTAFVGIPAGYPVEMAPGTKLDTSLNAPGLASYVGGIQATAIPVEGYSFGENEFVFGFDFTEQDCEKPVVPPVQPPALVQTWGLPPAVDCEAGTATDILVTATTEYVLEDGEWVLGEPVFTHTYTDREATAEECPVFVPPVVVPPVVNSPTGDVPVVVAAPVQQTLATTGFGLVVPLMAGLGALGAGAGLLFRRRK